MNFSSASSCLNEQQLLISKLAGGGGFSRYLENPDDAVQRIKLIRLRIFIGLLTAAASGSVSLGLPLRHTLSLNLVTNAEDFHAADSYQKQYLLYLASSSVIENVTSKEMLVAFFQDQCVISAAQSILGLGGNERNERSQISGVISPDLDIIWSSIANLCSISPVVSIKLTVITLQRAIIIFDRFLNLINTLSKPNLPAFAITATSKQNQGSSIHEKGMSIGGIRVSIHEKGINIQEKSISIQEKRSCHWQLQCALRSLNSILKVTINPRNWL